MSIPPNTSQTGPVQPETPQSIETEESVSGFDVDDLLSDGKFYQDTAIELQNAYDTLQQRYAQQAHLIQEASGALHVAETQASQRQQELLICKRTMKLMSNWQSAKWSLSLKSS